MKPHTRILQSLFILLIFCIGTQVEAEVIVPAGALWRYLDNGTDQGTAWRSAGYNDAGWAVGPAQLGYGDGDEQTVVSYGPNSSSKYITTYFRHTFSVADPAVFSGLILRVQRDDGVVVHLNGTEVFRDNLPGGTVSFSTLATTAIGGSDESTFLETSVSAAMLVAGVNLLAVEIHQANGSSSDISFDLELIGNTGAGTIVRGPYLQQATPDSIVIRWRTDAASDSKVRYGTSQATLNLLAEDPALTTEHIVQLGNLQAGTLYYYELGNSLGWFTADPDDFFITSPSSGSAVSTRIWVVGDSGTADANAAAVRNAYLSWAATRKADVWLMLGDNAYNSGTDAEFQAAVFNMYPTILQNTVLWPTRGNHESDGGGATYYDIFTMPTAGEAGGLASGTEAYYAFDYGNIHFICLDSQGSSRSTSGPMAVWLANDLAATLQPWIIAFWHHPPYSKGSHDSDTETQLIEMRANILPILEEGGVDLVLCGHSHSYERSFLLDGHYGTSQTLTLGMVRNGGDGRENGDGIYQKPSGSAPHEGAVYAVAGSSGKISGGPLNHPAMFISLNLLGSMVLDVNDNRLDVFFLQSDGSIADYFTMAKGSVSPAPPAAPTGLSASPLSDTEIVLSWTDNSVNETGFKIERSLDGLNFQEIAIVGANVVAGTDPGLQPNTTYWYRVRASNAAGDSAYSNTAQATTYATAPPSGGLAFDGSNDYVTFGPVTSLALSAFTLEAWFRRTGAGLAASTGSGGVSAVPLIAKGRGEVDGSNRDMNYFFGLRSNNVLTADFEEGSGGSSPGLNHPVAGATPITMNTWHHAAATYDGTRWRLYLDGILDGELLVGQPVRADSIQHASLATALNSSGLAEGAFAGVLDEVRIWNYARSSAEIAAARGQQIPAAPGLIARWSLDEGFGATAHDSSGSGAHGSLVNGPVWTIGAPFASLPTVSLISPADQSVVTGPLVTFTCDAQDEVGLASATLYVGQTGVPGDFQPVQTQNVSGTAATAIFTVSLADSVDYTWNCLVSNSSGQTNWAPANFQVRVDALPPNTVPIADSQSLTTLEDTALAITLTGSDGDGDPLTYSLSSAPGHGSLTGVPPDMLYSPSPNYSGPDSFTFVVNDGQVDSSPATVSVNVTPVNDAPIAQADSAVTPQDVAVTVAVLANDSDVDLDPLAVSQLTQPTAGAVTLNADHTVTYQPNAGFHGQDQFTYAATDGMDSSVATVTITVQRSVVFSDDFESGNFTAGGWVISGQASVDGSAAASGTYGALLKKNAALTKVLGGLGAGNVSVTYWRRVSGLAGSERLIVEYSLDDQAWQLVESVPGTTTFSPHTFEIALTGSQLHLRFRLNGTAGNDLAMIDDVEVATGAFNAVPTANADAYSGNEDSPITVAAPGVLSNDSDPENDALSALLVGPAAQGDVSLSPDGAFTYTPNPNFHGTDSFTYRANDGSGDSAPATVTLTVAPVNDAPVANADSYAGAPDNPLTVQAPGVLSNDNDVDGDTLSASWVSGPSSGLLTLNADGSFTYTPANGFSGTSSFTYRATDPSGASATATVILTVQASMPTVHVGSIQVTTVSLGKGNKLGRAEVMVVSQQGTPVAGAVVTGSFLGDLNQTSNVTTDANGRAVFSTATTTGRLHLTFCVDNIMSGGSTYAPADNVETCASNF